MEGTASDEKAGSQPVGADASSGAAQQQTPSQTPPQQQSFSMLQTFLELPWHVVPFLFGMFALVEALRQGGWVDFFAGVRGCGSSTVMTVTFARPVSMLPLIAVWL